MKDKKHNLIDRISILGLLLFIIFGLTIKTNAQNCTINAGVTQTVCENETLTLYGSVSGLQAEGDETTWTQISGPSVFIENPGSLTTNVRGIVPGNYTFRIFTVCDDGSLVYQDVENIVLPITKSFAGNDMMVCPGSHNLDAALPGDGETGQWTILEPNRGISITDYTNPESEITVAADRSGETQLVWIITNPNNGCFSTDTVTVVNTGAETVSAGPDRTLSHCYSAVQSTNLNGSYAGSGINGQQGTWTLISGPNIPVISDIHNNNTGVRNLIEGTYVFRWEVEGPCESGVAYETITVPPPTSDVTGTGASSRDLIYCDGRTSIVLEGAFPRFTNETVLWEQISGPDGITIENRENNVTNVTGFNGTDNYSFRYTISNDETDCTSSSVVNIIYAVGPQIDIPDPRINLGCGESVAEVSFAAAGSGQESWSIVSGPFTEIYTSYPTEYTRVGGSSGTITIPGLTESGVYIVRIRKSAAEGTHCEAVFADVAVVVSKESSLSNSGTEQLLACNVFSTHLAGNTPPAGKGTWTQVSGPNQANIVDIHDPVTEIDGLINGTYKFRWIVSDGYFCNNYQDDVTVVVASTEPTQADAGEDQEVCINTPVFLNGSKPVLNEWGRWSVLPEDAPVVFNDPTSHSTYAEGFEANNVYQLIWTIENACGESSDMIQIQTNDTYGSIMSYAGEDSCFPSGTTSFSLSGNDPYEHGEWTQVNGTGATIDDPASAITNVTVPADGTYYFEWAITANGCEPTRDTVRITIAPDATTANAGSNQEICGNSATLTGNEPDTGTGQWFQIAGPGGVIIENEFLANTEISELTDGVYKFVWEISNEACDASRDTVTIYVSLPGEEAHAGDDINLCGVSSVLMQANNVAKGLWTVISGPNTPDISDYTSPNAIISNLIMGTYHLSWNSYGGVFCEPSADFIEITVVPAANAGYDLEYCEATTSVDLVGNINSTGTWRQIGDTPNIAVITQTSSNSVTASGLITGIYTFEYEISEGDCVSTDTKTITLLPPPPTADAGENAEYCNFDSFLLTGNDPEESTGEWTLLFGPSEGTFDYNNASEALFTPTGSNIHGTYVFTWKISNGDCENEDQVRVVNYAPPAGNAGEDIEINCESSVFLDATLESGSGHWTFISVTGDAPEPEIVSPVLPNTEITGLSSQSNGEPAVYQFEWTITSGTCDELTDVVTITVYQAPTEAFAGNDAELCSQNSYTLSANVPAVGDGEWSLISGPNTPLFNDINSAVTEVSGLEHGTYVFSWETKTEFCSSVDFVTVINHEEPSTPDVMADFDICQFESLILQNNEPESGTAVWMQTGGPSVTILNPEAAVTQVTGVTAGSEYTFRRMVSNGTCEPKFEDVTINVFEQPTMALAGSDQSFCNQTETVLNGNEPVVGTGTWTVEEGPNTPVFANENQFDTEVSGLTEGTYIFRWTISNQDVCETYDEMQVTVYPEMTVSAPAGGDICSNGTFNMSVTANGGTGTYSYQWQERDSEGEWINVSAGNGANSASYTTAANLEPGTYAYRVEVTDCNTIYSGEAEIIVHPDVEITVQPEGATICQESVHTLSVTAINGIDLSYQWQQSTTGTGGWSNIPGANSLSYTTEALASTMFYRVTISDAGTGCSNTTSDAAGVYIPEITTEPAGMVICDGGAHTMSVSTENRGGITYTFQWQQSGTSGGTWSNIDGATENSYTTGELDTGDYYYRCVVTPESPACSPLVSSEAYINTVDDPEITAETGDVSICEGGTATHLVTVSGGTASSYSYQWQLSSTDCDSDFTDIAGANSSSYTTPGLDTPGEYFYRCVITQPESGCEVISACKTVTVVPDPEIDIQPLGTTICSGTTHTMSTEASGGTGAFSYQWQQSATGTDGWSDISGAQSDSYTTAELTTKTFFRVVISQEGVGCDELISEVAEVAVPEITVQPEGGLVCKELPETLSITVDAGSATLSYQWQFSDYDCNSGWLNIEGANDNFHITDQLPETGTRYFKCVVTVTSPDCEDLVSDCVAVTVTGCNPVIGVSNQLVTTEYNDDGTWDALFTIRVQNYGGTELNDIQVTQDLDAAFGPGNYTVTEITSTSFAVNTDYDGSSDTDMLTSSGNTLQPGASTDIVLKITILEEGTFYLSATGTGEAPDGTTVSDVSQNGSDPDPDRDGNPVNNNDPTPISTECVNASAYAGPDDEICAGEDYHILLAETENEEDFIWSTSGDGTFNSETTLNPVYTPGTLDIAGGTVTLTLTANSYGTCPAAVSSMTLAISTIIPAEPEVTDAGCIHGKNGTVQLAVESGETEPFIYEISTGESNSSGYFENLSAGNYLYRITDAGRCTVTGAFEIDDPNGLQLMLTEKTNVSCNGGNDGSITIEASGGTGGYTFIWPDGITPVDSDTNPQTADGFEAGMHFVTVTDENGCNAVISFEIDEPAELNILLTSVTGPSCNSEGTVTVTGTGGVPPYSFTASRGSVSENIITGLSAGEVIITITDRNGCTGELTVTLTDDDNEPPTFTCPVTQTIFADENCRAEVPDLTILVTDATDNCSDTENLTITQSVAAGTLISSDITVTVTVTDENGNAATCDVLLLVEDDTPPVAICKDITLYLDMTGTALINAHDIDNGSRGNCGPVTLSIDKTLFTCEDVGKNTVTLTVTDNNGNSTTCEATVTVTDNIDPVINCPAPIVLAADENCEALVPDFTSVYTSGNCGNVTVEQSPEAGTVIGAGITEITLTATSESGNSSECTTTVTVIDEIVPDFVCPEPIIADTDTENCNADIQLTLPEVIDNCSDEAGITISYRVFNPDNSVSSNFGSDENNYSFMPGISRVEWTMTDQAGNSSVCVQQVTVNDSQIPQIACPDGDTFTFDNSGGICGYIVTDTSLDATATDNCSIVTVEHDFYLAGNKNSLEGAVFPVGTTEVTWTATDNSGNSTECTITVIVEDTEAPEFVNCPDGTTFTVGLFAGVCEGGAIWSIPVATDNCGEVTVTQTGGPERGSLLSPGIYPVEYTATDAAGNETICGFSIEVVNTEGPLLVCPTEIVKNSDPGVCTWTSPGESLSPLLATSNCAFDIEYEITGATTAQGIDDASGTVFNPGTSTVTYTITEQESGQSTSCSFNVTINDFEAPQVTCPEPVFTSNTTGLCSAEIELELPEYTDNCDSDATITYLVYGPDNSLRGPFSSDENTFEFSLGISRVLWIVTDSSGNETTCNQEITVNETDEPIISCMPQDEYIFNSTPGMCGYLIPDTEFDASASDNCQLLSVTHNFGGWGVANSLEGALFPVGSTEVIWTATDYSGNSVSCNFTITVIDNEEPSFVNCPDGTTFTVGLFAGACEGGAIWSIPVATDNCGDVTVEQISGPERGSLLSAETYNIIYRATDNSGNSTTCSFNVEVVDTEYPVIVCQPDIEKSADTGSCTWESPAGSLTPLLANSNCPATVEWRVVNPDGTTSSGTDDVSGYTFRPGTSTVYYSIRENTSGQEWDCNFKVTVTDTEKPVVNCPRPIEITALPGMCDATVELEVPGYTDNCSDASLTASYVVYAPDNSVSNEIFVTGTSTYQFMAGINRVEWKVTDRAGNYSVCWQTVWVNADKDALIPDAGPNSVICENDTFFVTEAVVPEYAEIKWTTSGTGYFVDETVANPVYIPSESDILDSYVILTVTASSSCESASDNMLLTIIQTPEVWAGDDAEICEYDTYRLNGNISNRTYSVMWETLGTGTFSNPASFNPVYTPGAEDVEAGSVILIFKGISAGACEDAADSLTLLIHRQPEIFAGDDAEVCEGSSYTLADAAITYGNTVAWSTGGTGHFSNVNDINATYFPSESDILNGSVVLTATHSPDGPCKAVSGKMVLTLSQKPVVNAGSNIFACYGQTVTITDAAASGYATLNWTTAGKGELLNPTSLSPSYQPAENETGEVKFTVTITGTGACSSETFSDEVILTIYDELIADAGDNDTIFVNSTAILRVSAENGSGTYFYSWMPESMVFDSKSAYTETVELSSSQEFTVMVKDAVTGCEAVSSKTVFVETDSEDLLEFYNAISPNSDGVNDNWQIKGIENFPDNKVQIFNRWGDKVKELHNYDNVSVVWNGTNNKEKLLPDGTYYYIVTLNKAGRTFTGWVHIRSEN